MTSREPDRLIGSERVSLQVIWGKVYVTKRLVPIICLLSSDKRTRGTNRSYASWHRKEKYCLFQFIQNSFGGRIEGLGGPYV